MKQRILDQIKTFASIGDRSSAIDLWARNKSIISQADFEEYCGKGMDIYWGLNE